MFAGTPEALAEAKTPTAVFMREELGREVAEEAVDSHTRTLDPDAMVGDEEPEEAVEAEA